jgi:serine/threonine protein kinase/Flp pilus assembly protein TadD
MRDPLQYFEKLDRYELVRPLGQGGMGIVYLARDTELDRLVAIKCVDKKDREGSTKLAKRLISEARMMAQLNHPNIVHLHDVIENEDVLGLVIEYVEGTNLRQKSRELLPSLKQSLSWLIQIAEGLEKAHESGITHCDLKLENVLISDCGIIKIADFGIAKVRLGEALRDDGLTEFGNVSGSYFSLSPEQAAGARVDYRTDLFSFGILIYQLLTGHHPFGETNNHLVIVQRITSSPFKVSSKDQDKFSPELKMLIVSLLEKKPEDRPVSAAIVATCLRNEYKRESDETVSTIDLTIEMSAIPAKRSKKIRSSVIISSVIVGILSITAWMYWPELKSKRLYIAVTKPIVIASNKVEAQQLRRITTTIEHSTEEAILLNSNLNLIPNLNLQDYDGDPVKLAVANGADVLLLASAECSLAQCDVKLQKLENQSDNSWTVIEQRTLPVLADSLADIRRAIINELPKMFPDLSSPESEQLGNSLTEQNYRSYLKGFQRSNAGIGSTEEDLVALSSLQLQAPDFFPIYFLYTKIAKHLYATRGDEKYLQKLGKFLTSAPQTIKATVELKKMEFELLLLRGDTQQAAKLLTEIEAVTSDRVLLNDLKASIAYALNDYKTALQLDFENSLLRPSTMRYYKLAVSQYHLGKLDDAKVSISNALKLSPRHLYSMGLSAVVAMSEGDVLTAVDIYSKLVEANATSANLSNYGLALALNGSLESAINVHIQAKNLNPKNPGLVLNLADSYDLSGDKVAAKSNYQRVLDLTENPLSAQDFSRRSQALSHLGMHNTAIKTLRIAQEQFPGVAELDYAAAIIHTLAGNQQAAIVDVESAIGAGTGAIWFRFNWFHELCTDTRFQQLIATDENSTCSNN